MMRGYRLFGLVGVSVASLVVASAPALAQSSETPEIPEKSAQNDPDSMLGEIVVTAQKRASNVQTTPISISAITGSALESRQITDVSALSQQVAGVNFGQTTGNARIAIRGVGFDNISLGNEGRVAFHLDGVYESRPSAALTSFYDVERVEVLRGPQGTLYGRNATGGTVNVITRDPGTSLNGYLLATYGDYDLKKLEGAVGGELASGVSARIAFQGIERDGYGGNLTNGRPVDDQSTRAVRGKLRFEPATGFKLEFDGDYFSENDHAYGFHFFGAGSPPSPTTSPAFAGVNPAGLRFGGTAPVNPRDSTANYGPDNKREFWGVLINGEASLGFAKLTSLTAWRSSSFHTITDLDGTNAPLTLYDQRENADQFSQELRLAGSFTGGDWMVGGYYFSERLFGGTRIPFDAILVAPLPAPTVLRQGFYGVGRLDTKAYAAFGNLHVDLGAGFGVRVGARYSDETKRIDEQQSISLAPYPPFVPDFSPTPPGARLQQHASWSSFTPSASLEYKAGKDAFFYATYAEGFKSGGFNLGNLQPAFAPEKIRAYEAGIKAEWFDRRLRTNLSLFQYDYSNLQVSKVNGTLVTIENASNAKVNGAEFEIVAIPTEGLTLSSEVSLLDSSYRGYVSVDPARAALGALNLTGNDLSQAPAYTVNLAAEYAIPLRAANLTLRGEARFAGRVYFTQFKLDYVSQAPVGTYNLFATLKLGSGLSVSGFVRNLTNERVRSSALVGSGLVGFPLVGTYDPPRTYGVTFGFRF